MFNYISKRIQCSVNATFWNAFEEYQRKMGSSGDIQHSPSLEKRGDFNEKDFVLVFPPDCLLLLHKIFLSCKQETSFSIDFFPLNKNLCQPKQFRLSGKK